MTLDLSLVLNPSEVAFFEAQCEEKLQRINDAEIEAIACITKQFEDERSRVYRSVLLSTLEVALPQSTLPDIPAVSGDLPQREALASLPETPALPETAGTEIEDVETMSWEAASRVLGVSRDTVRLYASKGALEPAGAKGHVTRSSVEAYQESRITPGQHKKFADAPVPTFDVNEDGKQSQIEGGKVTYRFIKIFYLARKTTESGYLWDAQPNRECDPSWEVIEEWRCNGLGRWESTPEIPWAVGAGIGTVRGPMVGTLPQ